MNVGDENHWWHFEMLVTDSLKFKLALVFWWVSKITKKMEHFGVNSIFEQFLDWLWKVRNVFKVWKSVWFKYNPVERVSNQFWISLTKFRWFVLTFLDLLIWPFRPFQLFLAVLARKWSICLLNINSKKSNISTIHGYFRT